MQNVKLCQKYKLDVVVASFARNPSEMRSVHELKAFCSILGMHQKMMKESVNNLHKRILINRKKSAKEYKLPDIEH